MQPGKDINHYSTTLAELLCVGLGPWDEDRENSECKAPKFSENKIRKEWKPSGFKSKLPEDSFDYFKDDKLNNRDYSSSEMKRKIYQNVENVEDARKKNKCI